MDQIENGDVGVLSEEMRVQLHEYRRFTPTERVLCALQNGPLIALYINLDEIDPRPASN